MNSVHLLGRITQDLNLQYTQNNVAYLNFTVACDRRFKNQNGERQADFISCKAFKQSAEFIAKYFGKGSEIIVTGEGQIRTYEGKDGVNNLIGIYSAITGRTPEQIASEFEGRGYGDFKAAVGEAVVEELRPIREKYEQLIADKAYLEQSYRSAAEVADRIAQRTLDKAMKKIGFIHR